MCAWECCGMLRFGFPWLSERLPAGWSRALSFSWALNFQHSHTSKIATIMDSGFHSGWLHPYIWNQGQKGIQMLYIYHIWLLQLPFWLFVGLVLACFRPWFKPTHRFRTPHYVWPRNRDAMRRQVVWRWGVENPRWIWDDQFSWELLTFKTSLQHTLGHLVHWMGFLGFGTTTGFIPPSATPGGFLCARSSLKQQRTPGSPKHFRNNSECTCAFGGEWLLRNRPPGNWTLNTFKYCVWHSYNWSKGQKVVVPLAQVLTRSVLQKIFLWWVWSLEPG